MDWESLTFALDYLVSTGVTFSTEQRLAIQASLCVLQHDNQFDRVQFWGRIEGTEADYYIACGIGKDFLRDRTFFYSINNGLKWILLPPPTDLVYALGLAAKGHFLGDPSADAETECPPDEAYDIEEGDQWVFIKEEERLSATVAAIQKEAAIVPRGSLLRQPNGIVIENKTFSGLSKFDATQFTSYYHTCTPRSAWDKNIVIRADYNIALDFLDSVALDLPAGSWAIQIDKKDSLSIVRSLYWPGSIAYTILETPNYGWFYNGTGKKNWDVPFMILAPPPLNRAALEAELARRGESGEDGGEAGGDTLRTSKQAYMSQGLSLLSAKAAKISDASRVPSSMKGSSMKIPFN